MKFSFLMLERRSFPPVKKQKRPEDGSTRRVNQADIIRSAHAAANPVVWVRVVLVFAHHHDPSFRFEITYW